MESQGRLYAYRQWVWRPAPATLHSFSAWSRWAARQDKRAICWRNFVPIGTTHQVPGLGCSCGIYAWKDRPSTTSAPQGTQTAWGVVQLIGRVVVHRRGYRAERARIVALEYQPGIEETAVRYGAVLLDRLEEW